MTERIALKPTPPIEDGDFLSLGPAVFARDLRVDDNSAGLGVMHYFAEAVRLGYVPPDALLDWLAARFTAYLEHDDSTPSLDVALGLKPEKPKPGLHDARTRLERAQRTDGYVQRLAVLDEAGFNREAVLVYLNDGVPDLMPAYSPRLPTLDEATLEKYACEWRASPRYKEWRQLIAEAHAEGRMSWFSRLCDYVKKEGLG